MDQRELTEELRRLRVKPRDEGRAALYLPFLRETHAFLTETLKKPPREGLGDQYLFCRIALNNPNLLKELAAMLDLYLGPALNAEMTALNPKGRAGATATFAQFYASAIFDPVDATYVGRVKAFLAKYPTTKAALEQLTANFQSNIMLACQRIAADRAIIERCFAPDYPNLSLQGLAEMHSTGSDFHKGGKQVLILTFGCSYTSGNRTAREPFRLVYKPSDVAIDCLVAGNSRAINAVSPGFMAESLIEIFNSLRALRAATFPDARPLPTYTVLPRETLKSVGVPPFKALREFYGYIEYLSCEESGVVFVSPATYSYGASDFCIPQSAGDRPAVVTDFYQKMGQIMALACTFSLQDLHCQNVRIRRFEPYLIDLEVSLGLPVARTSDTALLGGDTSGITGYRLESVEFTWAIAPIGEIFGVSHELLKPEYKKETFQNRLIKLGPARQLVHVEPVSLCQGLSDGLRLLAGAPADRFTAWWTRAAYMLVRDLPYRTTDLKNMRRGIFLEEDRVRQEPAPNVTRDVAGYCAGGYSKYVDGDLPKYLVLAPGICEGDFQNLDLPVFYRCANERDIVDSHGNAIPILDTITIDGKAQDTRVGRDTYYPTFPVTQLRRALADLQGDPAVLARRAAALQQDVLKWLGLDALPGAPLFKFGPA